MNFFGKSLSILVIIGFVMYQPVTARTLNLSSDQMVSIVRIAKAVNAVNPWLEESKCLEYAMGIHRAALKYEVDPFVLVAIAQTETGFREDLAEGDAGEIGICQIRKQWLKSPKFVREFRRQTQKDLKKPAKNFLYAAWILHDLKVRAKKDTIPYWSFFNSVKFENRFRYFLAVNRNLASIKLADAGEQTRQEMKLASNEGPEQKALTSQITGTWSATNPVASANVAVVNRTASPRFKEANLGGFDSDAGKWIPDALRKLQRQQAQKELEVTGARNRRSVSPAILRAAAELGFGEAVRSTTAVQD